MKSQLITRAELFALVGVTGQKNSKVWEEHGMPYNTCAGAHGGKPEHLYDEETALRWLITHASLAVSERARKALQDLESAPPEEEEEWEDDEWDEEEDGAGGESEEARSMKRAGKLPTAPCWNMEPGTAGAFARMKEAELAFSSMLCAALAKGNLARAATCAGQVVALADGLAKLEAHLQGRKGGAGAVEVAAAAP